MRVDVLNDWHAAPAIGHGYIRRNVRAVNAMVALSWLNLTCARFASWLPGASQKIPLRHNFTLVADRFVPFCAEKIGSMSHSSNNMYAIGPNGKRFPAEQACDECFGGGRVPHTSTADRTCPACKGTGRAEPCETCHGAGRVPIGVARRQHDDAVIVQCHVCLGTGRKLTEEERRALEFGEEWT